MNSTPAMNPVQYQAMATPKHWGPPIPPNPPPSSSFWTHFNVQQHLQDLHQTLSLATALEKELEIFMKVKEGKGFMGKRVDHDHDNDNDNNNDNDKDNDVVEGLNERLILDEYCKVIEDNRIDMNAQEVILVEAVNGVMSKLRFLLEPFRVVVSDEIPWEEKSAVVRLSDKVNKSKRNKLWRKRKRRRVAESLAKKGEEFERLDREADEWRAKEIAKDMAQQKVEKMKQIAKQKAKEERKKLEAELELALMVEKLQELRSIRIQKLKKQGHFLPEEDDKFLERVRVAFEEEERQAKAAADTDAAKEAIAAAEESRKATQGTKSYPKDESSKENDGTSQQQGTPDGRRLESTSEESGQLCSGKQSYGAYDYVANLPPEFYHYYHGSNTDMGTLIEVRRTWDAYIRPGGSRIPGHWVQPPPPADEVWASYILQHN